MKHLVYFSALEMAIVVRPLFNVVLGSAVYLETVLATYQVITKLFVFDRIICFTLPSLLLTISSGALAHIC